MPRLRIVSIGAGGPDQLSVEAADALRSADFALMTRKRDDDPLEQCRREVVARHAPSLDIVVVADPERDRSAESTATTAGYEGVVRDWHDARAAAFEVALSEQWGAGRGDAVFLVWGDPAFYDSTIRIVEKILARGSVEFEWDVLPGISALHLLAARHRIVLHGVGEPLVVTTARRLHEALRSGHRNIVVMLVSTIDLSKFEDWTVYWGANLGTPSEGLVSGRVRDVSAEIETARRTAHGRAGWIMDILYLVAPPTPNS